MLHAFRSHLNLEVFAVQGQAQMRELFIDKRVHLLAHALLARITTRGRAQM